MGIFLCTLRAIEHTLTTMRLHYGQTKDINSILAKCERGGGGISNVIQALTIVLDLINLNHLIVADDKEV